jgi:nitroimidazol reductase NimA-like FMN-containing flavoprotein (pyridoxamine 5'-phosphate oxidase superfamily)
MQKPSVSGVAVLSVTVTVCALALAAALGAAVRPALAADSDAVPEIARDGRIVMGPPITPEQVKSKAHPRYPRGWVCSECHDVSFGVDFVSTASRQWSSNSGTMGNEQIWERVVKFLPGRERFVMATVHEDAPTATTVDLVLDKDEKVFYAVSEKGTEKLLHLRRNPNFSAVRAEGWTVAGGGARQWVSVQLKGQAEVVESQDPRFLPILEKYSLVRLSKERAVRRFDIQRIVPQQIVYFDSTLESEGFAVYQYWTRPATPAAAR